MVDVPAMDTCHFKLVIIRVYTLRKCVFQYVIINHEIPKIMTQSLLTD